MDGKVFTRETKDLMVKASDDALNLPFYLEPFDGPAFRILINFIDSKADKYVPDDIDPLINAAVTEALQENNFDAASLHIGTAINRVVNIPLLEEDAEQRMFVNGVKFLLDMIDNWIQNKKKIKAGN